MNRADGPDAIDPDSIGPDSIGIGSIGLGPSGSGAANPASVDATAHAFADSLAEIGRAHV